MKNRSFFIADVTALDEWAPLPQAPGGRPEKFRPGEHQTVLGVLPWYHSFGLTSGMLQSCLLGGRLICIPDPRAGKPPFWEKSSAAFCGMRR